jgi:hypothetical protein
MEDFRKGYYDVVYDWTMWFDHPVGTVLKRMTPKEPRCPRELPRCPGAINAGECPRRFRECAFNYIDGQLPK